MTTKEKPSVQADCLGNANTEPRFNYPSAADIEQMQNDLGESGCHDPGRIENQAWRLRSVRVDGDLVDEIIVSVPVLNEQAAALRRLHPFDEAIQAIADRLEDEARELQRAAVDAIEHAETAALAAWHGVAAARVDAALLDRRVKVLRAWFPTGGFAEDGTFNVAQDGSEIQISRGGGWIIAHERTANRSGVGLSALWSEIKGEPHHVVVERLAKSLGIECEAA